MSLAIERIDHVVLNCRDVETVADWYVRVLGMRREVFFGKPGCAAFRRSETQPAAHRSVELADGSGGFTRLAGSVFYHHRIA